MAEQWIDAATVAGLVMEGPHNLAARHVLCARAHSGLLQTRARLLVSKAKQLVSRQENTLMPPEFWWAEGDEALEQNWTAGDFSTWIGTDVQVQAFGVTFALSGMLELLAPEKRALAARQLSVAGNPAWVTARAARQFAWEEAGVAPTKAHMAVLDQARLGFLTARAVVAQRISTWKHGRPPVWEDPPDWEEREWDIPVSFWRDFKVRREAPVDWERGRFSGEVPRGKSTYLMRLEGVHFLAESLQSLLPAARTAAPVEETRAKALANDNPGGRPTAEWWDDLWCHVMAQIYAGVLTPNSQAKIEKAMHSWANDHGHEPAVSTIRLRARKLYRALKEVENSLDK